MTAFRSFPDVFTEVAARYPHSPALIEQGRVACTYAELLRGAMSLAQYLRGLGVGREDAVGLALGQSADHVVGMLGVWLAGAAFVPLDPDLPHERREFILSRARVRTVLDSLPVGHDSNRDAPPCHDWNRNPRKADDLAYIIFTSGSTGGPKGVEVTHRGIVNCLQAQMPIFGLTHHCRALFYLSPSFDASISDIGTALLAGAALCIEPGIRRAPGGVMALLRERGITHADLPPSLLAMLNPDELPESVRTIIIGGEVCPPEVVRRWARRVRLVNVYGPTEATICTSLGVCDPDTWDRPLLGHPIPNIGYQVVDEMLNPVAPGTEGELIIDGVGLARGYLNEAGLTEGRFPTVRGRRVYRTGDRVVLHPDGEMEFLGRLDRQIKLHGLRIEPEEIERALLDHPQVAGAAVVKQTTHRAALVAFIASHAKPPPSPRELREHLAARLPRWMLPHHFEIVASLPRTVTGKVDLSALTTARLTSPSRLAIERLTNEASRLRDIWRGVLGVDVGLDDDFFDLGGDSLGVLQVAARAEACGLPLPVSLFGHGLTLRQAVAHLERGSGEPLALSCDVLRKEAVLGATWHELLADARTRPRQHAGSPRCILLTGATGFLGSRLLVELVRATDAHLICLVRDGAALARQDRIDIIRGDIAVPYLGLEPSEWARLADDVDTIYHCAAGVNMVASYESLRPANVLGTREILRLLSSGRRKRLHYASTLSVFVSSDRQSGLMLESDPLESMREIHGGYAQTKWAAEYLLRQHESAAGPITYYRLGLLTGDSRTGVCSSSDHLGMVCRGLVKLGCVPDRDLSRWKVDVTPIDYAVSAMRHLSLQALDEGQSATFHLANARSLSLEELVHALETWGKPLERVDDSTWRRRLDEVQARMNDPLTATAFLGLCRCLGSGEVLPRQRSVDLFQATDVTFDMTHTLQKLADSGIACPPTTIELLHRYLAVWFAEEKDS